jgi:hypothetical protein
MLARVGKPTQPERRGNRAPHAFLLRMISPENRFARCAHAALRVRIMP